MVLNIDLFRTEKGGDLAAVRLSQKNRFKDEKLVDSVVAADEAWRKGETVQLSPFSFQCASLLTT